MPRAAARQYAAAMASNGARNATVLAPAVLVALVVLVGALWAMVLVDFRGGSGGAAASTGAGSSPTGSASPDASGSGGSDASGSAPSGEGTWTMDDASAAFATDGSRTLVLGDGTGDGWDEWAFLWAEANGLPGAMWMTQTENGYSGVADDTRLWSGGATESTADYPLEHWDAMWPAMTPDLVLLNYGHAYSSGDEATTSMEALREAIAEEAPETPIVVILQNPQAEDANAPVREAIAGWAQEAGLPTIDVAAAFAESDQIPANLRLDSFHPSTAGSELWAQTVTDALA